MNFLVIFYSVLLVLVVISPFYYVKRKLNQSTDDSVFQEKQILNLKREMLLDNLRDLRTEMDMKKLSLSEFQELSSEIVENLKEVDKEIQELPSLKSEHSKTKVSECAKCHFEILIEEAKFCPMCGNPLNNQG